MWTLLLAAAQSPQVELPYMVGPEAYEIYTDAQLYTTLVTINGGSVPLHNAEGNGVWGDGEGIIVEGPIGRANRKLINGYLRPGKNTIVVAFVPSTGILKYLGTPELERVASTMYTRVVVTRGRFNEEYEGPETTELDALVAKHSKSKAPGIAYDQRSGVPSVSTMFAPIRFAYELELTPDDKVARAKLDVCELERRESKYALTATLHLNDTLVEEVSGNESNSTSGFREALVSGPNTLKFVVAAVSEPTHVTYGLKCSLDAAKEAVGLTGPTRFETFFDIFGFPFAELDVATTGLYETVFEIRD